MTIRVLLADDQPLIRQALRVLIDGDPGMDVVGEASTGIEAIAGCRAASADVVLMDNHMPGLSGVEASRRITGNPQLSEVRILMHTAFLTEDLVAAGVPAGISGFLTKGGDPAVLLQAIRDLAER
ncbi:response regulator [Actinoplanes couchii]|uniref:Response regulatory domain-containing protein n=1 Tax=Actinoplanes couchii TaxID=403638 RepID=A0ABQ3XNU0_9ACTN|nr:response regulator transcription factor [Actinoplanes couchii]MDR6319600.1 DNA-binding NarL/FixJ family response regulator [Actinoplanes couchii]GID60177.1 hypothetical protein Aco03nite_085810 [Actinoplanes couchii]